MYGDFPYKSASIFLGATSSERRALECRSQARYLYQKTCRQALLSRLKSFLGRRAHRLRPLQTVIAGDCHDAGIRTVPIEAIVGSEGRPGDFDVEFRPRQDRTAERWMSVAAARLHGDALPPVELLQVGEEYYVRDGHHRVSVARALGECFVDAQVTVCG